MRKKMIEKSESFTYSQRSSFLVNVEGRIKHSRTNCRWHFFPRAKRLSLHNVECTRSIQVGWHYGHEETQMTHKKFQLNKVLSAQCCDFCESESERGKEMVEGKYVKRVDFPQFSEYKYANCLMMMALWQQIEIVDNFKAFKRDRQSCTRSMSPSWKSPLCERIWKLLKFFSCQPKRFSLRANYCDKNSYVERGDVSRKVLERQ